jgi:hypothetical protein
LEHPPQQPNEHRRPRDKTRCERYRFLLAASRDRSDDIVQNALLAPARRQLIMFWTSSLVTCYIGGTMLEELQKRLSHCLVDWDCV